MLNNFIYAETKELFLDALNNNKVLDEAIVFIADTGEIWNHGTYFAGDNWHGEFLTETEAEDIYVKQTPFSELQNSITQHINTHSEDSVSLNDETLTVKIGGIEKSLTNTHRTSKNIVGDNDSATTDGASSKDVYLRHFEDGSATSTHKISGSGNITVSSDANGNITIASTDTDTTYTAGAGLTLSDENVFSHADTSNLSGSYGQDADVTQTAKNTASFVVPQITVDEFGHVTAIENKTITVTDTDTNDNTTYDAGVGLKLDDTTFKAKLKTETNATYDSTDATNTQDRQYPVVLDKSGYLSVNVPWTDTDTNTDTTYSAGTGLSLSGTVFNLEVAKTDEIGGIKLGYSQSEKNYPVQIDSDNKAYVNVPWTDTNDNTTYTAGDHIVIKDNEISAKWPELSDLGAASSYDLGETNKKVNTLESYFEGGVAKSASSADNANTVDGYHFEVVTALPASPDENTIYFIKG